MPADARKVFSDPRYLLAYGFGSGLLPRMPGTFGTIAAVPFYLLLAQLHFAAYVVAVVLLFGLGVYVCDRVARELNQQDPGAIVFDEFVGLWIALFLLPTGWYWLLTGIVLFRIFDILKPWPVGWLDRNLKGGLGIMADDVAAGVYAFACLQLLFFSVGELV